MTFTHHGATPKAHHVCRPTALACASILMLGAACLMLGAACGPSLQEVRPTARVAAAAGAIRAEATRILLTDDVVSSGVGDGTAVVVELTIANGGAAPYGLNAASLSCQMELDAERPGETLTLLPAAGGEGGFPGEADAVESPVLTTTIVPPGQTRSFWALFRGYRFPGSDAPRRITIALPAGRGGPGPRLVIADPARGLLRWNVTPAVSGWMYGVRSSSLAGAYSSSSGSSTRIARVFQAGRLQWDAGLVSTVLVQVKGALISPTSTFTGTGVEAHLTVPLAGWGSWQEPRRLGLYAGTLAQVLLSVQPPPPRGEMPKLFVYGEVDAELGVQVDIGALRLAASPFPLSWQGRPLPRWLFRVGYTHAWIGHGSANGFTTGIEFAW